MSSYLTIPVARLLLQVDCMLRYALAMSRCAYVDVWLERMADIFPSGFLEMIDDIRGGGLGGGRARRRERITLVDYHRIPVPAASTIGPAKREKNNGDGDDCDSDEDARRDDIANVNLPLLAGLMPARYPQRIDERTLMSTTEGDYYHGTTTMSDNKDRGADDKVDDDDNDEDEGDEDVDHDNKETLFVMMTLGGVIGDNRNCDG